MNPDPTREFWAVAMTYPIRPGYFDIVPVHALTDAQLDAIEAAMKSERDRRKEWKAP